MSEVFLACIRQFVAITNPFMEGLPYNLKVLIRVALLIAIASVPPCVLAAAVRRRVQRIIYKEKFLKDRKLLAADVVLRVRHKKGLLGLNLKNSLATDEIQNNHLAYLGEIYNKKFLEVRKFRRDDFFYFKEEGVPASFNHKEIERLKLGEMELVAGKTKERNYKIDLMRISGIMLSIPTGAGKSTLILSLLYTYITFNKGVDIIVFDPKSGADYRQFQRLLFPDLKIFNPLIMDEFQEGVRLLEKLHDRIMETQDAANKEGMEIKNHFVLKRKSPEILKYNPTILVFDELPRYSNPQAEYEKERRELVSRFANYVNRATATYRSSLVKVVGVTQRPNRDEMPAIKIENFLVKILGEVAPSMAHSLGGIPSNFLGRKDFIHGKFLYVGDDGSLAVVRTPYIGDSDDLKPKPRTGPKEGKIAGLNMGGDV